MRATIRLLLLSVLITAGVHSQPRPASTVITAEQYFSALPFPDNCSRVPLLPSKLEAFAIYYFKAHSETAIDACKAYSAWHSRGSPKFADSDDTTAIGSALASEPSFARESEQTKAWLAENFRLSQKQLVRDFLNDSVMQQLRGIGPETNWALLQGLDRASLRASLLDITMDIKIDRFTRVRNTPGYKSLPHRLKDFVAAHLLSTKYVFASSVAEEFRKAMEVKETGNKHLFFRPDPALTRLLQSDSAPRGILSLDSKTALLFHQLNDALKADLIHLLFESWHPGERTPDISLYSLVPVSFGERGLYSLMTEEDGSTLLFLCGLNVQRVSTVDRRAIVYSLLEGGVVGGHIEMKKRVRYLQELFRSSLFSDAPADVQTLLIQASRIPSIGNSRSTDAFDFRDRIGRILDVARSLTNGPSFTASFANLTSRLRANWYLSRGSPAATFIQWSPYPLLREGDYIMAQTYLLSPDQYSAKTLDNIQMLARGLRDNADGGIMVPYSLLPKKSYRAALSHSATRQHLAVSGLNFATQDVSVVFDDDVKLIIHVPVLHSAIGNSHPPPLATVISALGLAPPRLRRSVSHVYVVPTFERSGDRDGRYVQARYYSETNTIALFQVPKDSTFEDDFKPAASLIHEYGHLLFENVLGMSDPNSKLLMEYESARKADKAEVSEYAQTDADEDFAESLELLELLKLVPAHDLEHACPSGKHA